MIHYAGQKGSALWACSNSRNKTTEKRRMVNEIATRKNNLEEKFWNKRAVP